MPNLTQSVEIQARPDVVETVYRDFEAYPWFIAPLAEVKEHDGLLDCQLKVAGFTFPYTARVDHVAPGRYRWETVNGTLSHRGTVRIEPEGEGSRLTMDVSFDPPGGELVAKVANWPFLVETGVRYALESFKAHVEAR